MKQIIRLTENDLARIVRRVINESPDPKLDFILTNDEKGCMNPYFQKPNNSYRWLKSEDGTQIEFGVINSSSYFKNYCKFDINNRPMNSTKEFGTFEYNKDTGVISFYK